MMSSFVLRTVVLTGEKSALDPKLFRNGSSSCDPLVPRERSPLLLNNARGALFYQLCTHLSWIDLYPINPHSLSSFRLTFFSSRAKDDPKDGQLLEELLRTHCDRLRPYQPEATTER